MAAADVQNQVLLAEPKPPEIFRPTGISVTKQSSGIVLAMALYSENKNVPCQALNNIFKFS